MIGKDAKIVVVGGGGTMGSSTALHLARRGYENIRVLDVYQTPSAQSAGNDMNKLISTQYVKGIWGRLAFETWEAWQSDPLFRPHLHPTGRVDIASGSSPREDALREQYDLCHTVGKGDNVEWLVGKEDIVRKAPYLTNAAIEGWNGLWCRDAGWVAARDALDAVGRELHRLGVASAFGTCGTFESLLLSEDGKTVRGVKAVDGTEWEADLVVLATGAWSPSLVDLHGQCESKCWQYGHVQLKSHEAARLKGTPPVYSSEIGFTMEPSASGVMKWVNEFQGYTRYAECHPYGSDGPTRLSVPRSHAMHPKDTIPDEGRKAIERVIETFMPDLSGRPLFDTAVCWCADSFDGHWLMCEDPRYRGLVLATGDSGHTFKMLPIVGKYVCDLIEKKLSEEDLERWRWRPEKRREGDLGREGARPRDLAEVPGWKHE